MLRIFADMSFSKILLQGNCRAVSKVIRKSAIPLSLRRSLHFGTNGVSCPTLVQQHRRLLLDYKTYFASGSHSAYRLSSSDAGTPSQSSSAPSTLPNVSDLPEGYIPEPPLPPAPSMSAETGTELIQQLNALGEPTLQSLGLAGWYPNGLVQTALEAIHVNLGVPWWTAIIIGTVCLRILVFPLVVLAQKNAANMHNHMPIVQKLQAKFSRARTSGNALEAARAGAEMMDYMKHNDVSPIKNMLVPFVQLPVFLSVFVGIRQMANLPVQSMTTGGAAWFTDLTIPDPYYALPLITMATFFITIELGVDGVRAATMTKTLRYIMRAMPFVIFPFIINFPSGMLCYWLTSNVFSLLQVLVLKIQFVRKLFKIPQMVIHDPSLLQQQKTPFIKGLKENWKNSKTMTTVEDRQRAEAVRFREAGLGAVQKTYSHDPTKVKPSSNVSAKSK